MVANPEQELEKRCWTITNGEEAVQLVEKYHSDGDVVMNQVQIILHLSKLPHTSQSKQAEQTARPVRRILVVDDEENIAATLRAGLSKLPNCTVAMAYTGEQALQLFEQQAFDLLVTDYKMPGIDGIALATQVRQKYPATAILMITAYNGDELRQQAEESLVKRILDKPVRMTEIRSAVTEALGQTAPGKARSETGNTSHTGGWNNDHANTG